MVQNVWLEDLELIWEISNGPENYGTVVRTPIREFQSGKGETPSGTDLGQISDRSWTNLGKRKTCLGQFTYVCVFPAVYFSVSYLYAKELYRSVVWSTLGRASISASYEVR